MGLVDLALGFFRAGFAFGGTQMQQLSGVVPLVQRLALLQAVVALQAQQLARQHLGQGLGQLGLADAGFALQQQRAAQAQGQKGRSSQAPIGEVARALQGLGERVDAAGDMGQGSHTLSNKELPRLCGRRQMGKKAQYTARREENRRLDSLRLGQGTRPARPDHARALATARCAITPTRWAR